MKNLVSAAALSLLAASASAQFESSASITQSGAGNRAHIDQQVLPYESGAQASITQVGNNNLAGDPLSGIAGIVQRESDSVRIALTQVGHANTASIELTDGNFKIFELEQRGNANFARLSNSGSESVTRMKQTGDGNSVDVGADGVLAYGTTARQNGTGNDIKVTQHWSGFGGPEIDQDGIGNRVVINQERADYSGFGVVQSGSNNQVRVDQINTLFNDRTQIDQQGIGNQATLTMNGSSSGSATRQTGDLNESFISQSLDDNRASINQTGNGNYASVTQTGAGGPFNQQKNSAAVIQAGDGFVANTAQSGAGNHAVTYQH